MATYLKWKNIKIFVLIFVKINKYLIQKWEINVLEKLDLKIDEENGNNENPENFSIYWNLKFSKVEKLRMN